MKETKPTDHSIVGPSGAKRYIKCPLSVELVRRFGAPNSSSEAARRGTANHELGAQCLLNNFEDPVAYLGEVFKVEGKDYPVRKVDVQAMRGYVQYVKSIMDNMGPSAKLYVELELDMTAVHPELWGQGDAVIVSDDELWVIDYKNGKTPVDGTDPQFWCYLLGAVLKFGPRPKLNMARYQPNIEKGKAHAGAQLTPDLLADWVRDTLMPALERCFTDGNEPCEGDWCFFCPAKGNCPAKAKKNPAIALSSAVVPFKVDNLTLPDNLGDDAIAYLMHAKKTLTDYLKAVEEEAKRRARKGTKLKGLALTTTSKRTIQDADGFAKAMLRLGVEVFEDKLMGVTALDTLIAGLDPDIQIKVKNVMAKFIVNAETETLKPVTNNAETVFDDLTK